MATNVSMARVNHLMDRVKSLQVSKANLVKKGKQGVVMLSDALVVNAGSFGVGILQGRMGERKIFGIPVELLGAGVFHGAALMGLGGHKLTGQLHNLGNGVLAAYTSALGRGVGRSMRTKAGLPTLSGLERAMDQIEGEDHGGGGHSDDQLMKLARRM